MASIIEMGSYRGHRALAYIAQVLGESVTESPAGFPNIGLVAPLADNGIDNITGLARETVFNNERGFWKRHRAGLYYISTSVAAPTATLDGAKMTLDIRLEAIVNQHILKASVPSVRHQRIVLED